MYDQAVKQLVVTTTPKADLTRVSERVALFDEAGNPLTVHSEAELNSQFVLLDPSSKTQDLSTLITDLQTAGLSNIGVSSAAPGVNDGGAPFTIHDTFEGSAVTLSARMPTIGSSWGVSAGGFDLDGSGGLKRTGSVASIAYITAGTSDFDIHWSQTNPNQAGVRGGVIIRYIDSLNFLWIRADESGQKLIKRVSGTDTTIGSWSGTSQINTTKTYRAEIRGASVALYSTVDGFIGNWTLTYAEASTFGASTIVGICDIASNVPARFITFNHIAVVPTQKLSLLNAANKVTATPSGIVTKLAAATTASLLIISDSTADANDEWVYRLGQKVAFDSTYGVDYYKWTLGGGWPTATVIDAGSPKLQLLNTATASQGAQYFIDNWSSITSSIPGTPDAVIISLGHNDAYDSTLKPLYRTLIATIRNTYATVPIMIVLQNPHQVNVWFTTFRRQTLYELALELNLDYIDVWHAFGGTVPDSTLYASSGTDTVHPSTTGSKRWMGVVWRTMFPDGINPL
jgi:lysophospholipase L1-like esterase